MSGVNQLEVHGFWELTVRFFERFFQLSSLTPPQIGGTHSMARKRASYSKEEIRDASKTVMKSLNLINRKTAKSTLSKPLIANSLGKQGGISKSSQRRRTRKEKSNLAGKSMASLMEALPEVPTTAEVVKEQKQRTLNPGNRKGNQRLVNHETQAFKATAGLSLSQIKQKLLERQQAEAAEQALAELAKSN